MYSLSNLLEKYKIWVLYDIDIIVFYMINLIGYIKTILCYTMLFF